MALTDKGYENILDIAVGRCGLKVDRKFIDEHYDTFVKAFPASDDPEYVADFPEADEAWWTFDAECNGGGIGDTGQREEIMDIFAQILFGMCWPCYGDTNEYQNLFNEKLNAHKEN